MDPNLPNGQPAQPVIPQPVQPPLSTVPPSQPFTPPSNNINQPMDNDMASRSHKHNDVLIIFLALLAGALIASAYFVIGKPKTSGPVTINNRHMPVATIGFVNNTFQPLPAIEALNNCGLTDKAQQTVDQSFVTDAGLSFTILGQVQNISYPSTTQATLTIKKYQSTDTITIPVMTANNDPIKTAQIVYDLKNRQLDQTLSSLKTSQFVNVTLYCRTQKSNTAAHQQASLSTVKIVPTL